MHWNFQSVKCMDKRVKHVGKRKREGQKAAGFKKNEYACRVEGVFEVFDSTANQYLKLASLG